jgi:hypothetical protein
LLRGSKKKIDEKLLTNLLSENPFWDFSYVEDFLEKGSFKFNDEKRFEVERRK